MLHNESVYPDPHTFNPNRFLKDGQNNPEVKDPDQITFGYGRRYFVLRWMPILYSPGDTSFRICPGRNFVVRILFFTFAQTLATFDISKCLDEDENPIVPKKEFPRSLFL